MATVEREGPKHGTGQRRGARNVGVLVSFTAITNLADGVTKVALPLMAVGLTDSPALVAGVGFTLTLPWLLIALHIGVLVDRADRRRLVSLAEGMRLVVVAALLLAVAADALSLPLLYLAGLVLGVAEVVAQTSLTSLVPAAVPRERLERVNGWVAGAETVANEFAGPALGGLLLTAGAGVALGSTAAAYVAGLLLIMLLAGGFRARPTGAAGRPPAPVRADIAVGLRFLWSHPLLRTMTLTIAVLAGAWSAWLVLLPSYAEEAHLSEQAYGLVLSCLGLGGLTGVFAVGTVNRLMGRRRVLFADLLGTFAMLAVPVVTANPWAVAAGAFAGGVGGTLWTVNSRTIVQLTVPDELMGRFNAAARLLGWGTLPLGAALAGAIAQLAGVQAAFIVFAAAAVVAVVPFLRTVTPAALAEIFPPGGRPRESTGRA
ncbi:MFS transporter [Actinomadura alba]|uniref:MFS transporter n=1 Tax=Actinomadura alba TaxID=406431 RepID=A0ABR7M041_9ACTN|nr:MFS transporter [Actinomadura alba]MBC6469993.1 MFS transporter [Actinomadura alba]